MGKNKTTYKWVPMREVTIIITSLGKKTKMLLSSRRHSKLQSMQWDNKVRLRVRMQMHIKRTTDSQKNPSPLLTLKKKKFKNNSQQAVL